MSMCKNALSTSQYNRRSMRLQQQQRMSQQPGHPSQGSDDHSNTGVPANFINISSVVRGQRQHVEADYGGPSRMGGMEMSRGGAGGQTSQLQNMFESVKIPVSKPPPPPPPPPPPALFAPPPPPDASKMAESPTGAAATSPSSDGKSPAQPIPGAPTPAATPSTPGVNFLSDIRGMQFKLKKTESEIEAGLAGKKGKLGGKKKPGETEEVAAILMRRVALEVSDSDEEEDDDDDEWD
eukprot:jgi/Hompol1/653/HPOL_001486-RA